MATVYLETTFIGNVAGRLHSDALIAARQEVTRRRIRTADNLHFRAIAGGLR